MGLILELPRIVQAVAESTNAAEQVKLVVDSIQRVMDVDACSLYLSDDSAAMVLVASHGLGQASVGRTRLPAGQGLIGLVAKSRHPLNITHPEEHPQFLYVPESGEEVYSSFCGVPLARSGETVGVLVVQCIADRVLSSEEEAFLVTLGAQLALVVANWADWQSSDPFAPRTMKGVIGAPGIGIGQAHICRDSDLFSVVDGTSADREREAGEWNALLARVRDDVGREQRMLGKALSGEVAAIFDAYHMLLADPALVEGVRNSILVGKDLPSALKAVVQHHAELFKAMEDPYLRARHEDIHHLGNRLYGAWLGDRAGSDPVPEGGLVLVGKQVNVSDIAAVPRERISGIVSLQGSTLSHTAILANALGIPAVMGLGGSLAISQGDQVIVDANTGRVLCNPVPQVIHEYSSLLDTERDLRGRLARLRHEPALTRDGKRITLLVNSGLLADLSPGLEAGAEGIGLYRTEIPFLVREGFPTEDEQVDTYRRVIEAYGGRPVCMRVLDIGGDKQLPYFPISEENPALGWRGIRFCLDNAPLLMTQLRAMLRAAAGSDCMRILLPMISTTRELIQFHGLLADALRQLQDEGLPSVRPRVGVMVEVPAAISQLALWRPHLDFVSVGTNDLSQYLLAVDRGNSRVSAYYDHLNPAVLRELARITATARELALPLSVCGEMASDPAAAMLLLGMDIDTLSLSAAQLPRIKWLVRQIEVSALRQLLQEVLLLSDGDAIRARTQAFLEQLGYPGRIFEGD